MKPWRREDTKDWIAQMENRVEDHDYYIEQTMQWLDNREIHDQDIMYGCLIMTVIWVSYMRNEQITQKEVFEILGLKNWDQGTDNYYDLGKELQDLDHEQLLEKIASRFH
jgi:hypothetical protein